MYLFYYCIGDILVLELPYFLIDRWSLLYCVGSREYVWDYHGMMVVEKDHLDCDHENPVLKIG